MASEDQRKLVTAALVGTGICIVLLKGHGRFVQQVRSTVAYLRNPLRKQFVQVVNTAEECEQAIAKLKIHCSEYNVLGFDCEWVSVNGSRRPVALLQLAAHNGYCALIRLCHLRRIPLELRELLESDDILKVGVVPMDDAKNLSRDYGVSVGSTLDLRHLARHYGHKTEGLAKMALQHLNVVMDKDWRISCSDWEAATLNDRQIDYAAKDALVAVELYRHFVGHRNQWFVKPNISETVDKFAHCLDVPFGKTIQQAVGTSSRKHKLNTAKPLSRSICTRATPLYQNCFLQAPDGQLLCMCDYKKAAWYVSKNIGEVITTDPYTVRLKFEPAGRAVGEVGKFYQQEKANQCVVCGNNESYQRKNIVPREYRKYFPVVMKDHTSHDVLLMCPICHQRCNIIDLELRIKLARLADAPFGGQENSARIEKPDLKKLKSAAKALHLSGSTIPESRNRELRTELLKHFPAGTEITDQLLKETAEMNTYEVNTDFSAHGKKVVDYFKSNPDETGGLIELERMWRTHFLAHMLPKFLPDLWSVEHNVEKIGIRIAENRITENELLLVGMKAEKVQ